MTLPAETVAGVLWPARRWEPAHKAALSQAGGGGRFAHDSSNDRTDQLESVGSVGFFYCARAAVTMSAVIALR